MTDKKYTMGDIVIANKKANEIYSVTVEGVIGKITSIHTHRNGYGSHYFTLDLQILEGVDDPSEIGRIYTVKPECFDYLCAASKITNVTIKRQGGYIVASNNENKDNIAYYPHTSGCSFEEEAQLALQALVRDDEKQRIKVALREWMQQRSKLLNTRICITEATPETGLIVGKIYSIIDGVLEIGGKHFPSASNAAYSSLVDVKKSFNGQVNFVKVVE